MIELTMDCVFYFGVFTFNADYVPTFPGDNVSARGPVCKSCLEAVNRYRKAQGIPLIPTPEGTYVETTVN